MGDHHWVAQFKALKRDGYREAVRLDLAASGISSKELIY
jgi:hypothetical protein